MYPPPRRRGVMKMRYYEKPDIVVIRRVIDQSDRLRASFSVHLDDKVTYDDRRDPRWIYKEIKKSMVEKNKLKDHVVVSFQKI